MRNIIITGANQGIGYYMAEKFLAMGDRIAILDIETDNLRILENQYGDRLCTYECDLTETEAVCDAVSDFVKRFGSVEIAHPQCLYLHIRTHAKHSDRYLQTRLRCEFSGRGTAY